MEVAPSILELGDVLALDGMMLELEWGQLSCELEQQQQMLPLSFGPELEQQLGVEKTGSFQEHLGHEAR